jgi:hypothetical protein
MNNKPSASVNEQKRASPKFHQKHFTFIQQFATMVIDNYEVNHVACSR